MIKIFLLFLQKILGYCVTGEINSVTKFYFVGDGSNGKTYVLQLLKNILNEFCIRLPYTIKNVNDAGIRVALVDEYIPCSSIDDPRGTENQTACFTTSLVKMSEGEKRKLGIKSIIQTNCVLDLDLEAVIWLPFNAKFFKNPQGDNEYLKNINFSEKIKQAKFKSAFLNFLIAGAQMYYNNVETKYF